MNTRPGRSFAAAGAVVALAGAAGRASAHVDYVTDPPAATRDALEFMVEILSDPLNAILLGGGILTVFTLVAADLAVRPAIPDIGALRDALQVVERYDLTAVVPVDAGLWVVGAGLTEMAVGALLVFGFYTRGAAAVAFLTLVGTLFGLPDDPVLAHITLFGLLSAVFTLGSGPYSLDAWLATNSPRADRGAMSATPADD